MTKKVVLSLLIFSFIKTAIGQANYQDSIASQIQKLVDEAWEYTLANNDSSLVKSNQALKISKNQNYDLGIVLAKESLGLYHEIVEGDIEKASNYYFEAIEICEEKNLDYLASMYHTLGLLYHLTDNYKNGKQYYTTALKLAREQNDSLLLKKILINLGAIESSLQNLEAAENYMLKSINIPLRKDLDYTTYANLGHLYVKLKRFDEAISFLLKSTEVTEENTEADLNLYFLLYAKVQAKDSSNMKIPLQRAIKAVKENNYGLRDQSLLLKNIADYLAFTGNYKDALAYRNQYIEVFEEIKQKQRDEIVLETEAKYENEKKEAQLKVLTLENEKAEQQQKLYLIIAFIGIFIAGLVGYFLFKNNKKNKLLAKQKSLLEATVDEKNVLLKETHHRVKNSFQIVSSLLYLQAESITDKEGQLALKEAQNRVRSMVLIHQKLYSKDQLVGIDAQEYISDLIRDILESHQEENQAIEYDLKIEPLVLSIETITPLGLIINELVTNVLKHAFPSHSKNKILEVSLKKENEKLVLKVIDNGVGMPNVINESSFGIQLVKSLAKKLKAKLSYQTREKQGTIASVDIYRFDIL